MPKHTPIKFEKTLEPSILRAVEEIMKSDTARSIKNATLALIAVGGVLTIGAIAPNVLGAIGRFRQQQRHAQYEKYRQLWSHFRRMKKRGEVEYVENKDDRFELYRLTVRGKEKIKCFIFDEMRLSVPSAWDGKWRLVIFDIPERFRKGRGALREKLRDLGFYQCQKSAWIHPFPCTDEVAFLSQFFGIQSFVKLFLVEEMTDGKTLYHFKELLKQNIVS